MTLANRIGVTVAEISFPLRPERGCASVEPLNARA
jgi:hypothetical protein